MLELSRVQADVNPSTTWCADPPQGLALGLASTPEELEAIQRLRYKVFTEEMNAHFPDSAEGIDSDRFDPWCKHFMVREVPSGRVVGTYRLLTPEDARKAGGYYSESEFDLSGLGDRCDQLVEVGRSCTHPDYRNGTVIMLLWSGIAKVVQEAGYRHVLGCASVSLRDDGVTAAQVWRSANAVLQANPQVPRVQPHCRYPVERLDSMLPARVPPLIKGYLRLGATICGEPAWDPDFNTADFPVLLDLDDMDMRYRRHFGMV
jgi:putative hemolysin